MVSVTVVSAYETVYAVSYGDDNKNHTDSLGVSFTNTRKDCESPWYFAVSIRNIPIKDQSLYHGYCHQLLDNSTEIPLAGAGRYLLVLKFRTGFIYEVDMMLNKQHYILRNFDAMNTNSNNNAFDVTAVFTVCGDRLIFNNEISTIINNSIELKFKFIKGGRFISLTAIGLFKDSNEKLPVPLATNIFKGNDWSQQTLSCSYLQLFEKLKQSIVTNNYNFNFNIDKMDINSNKDSLVEDEF